METEKPGKNENTASGHALGASGAGKRQISLIFRYNLIFRTAAAGAELFCGRAPQVRCPAGWERMIFFMNKRILRGAGALALALALMFPLAPAALAAEAAAGTTAGTSATQTVRSGHRHAARLHCGRQETALLAEISGKSVAELNSRYPQKTAWQMAKTMGMLDALKKSYLARGKVMIEGMVESKSISEADGAKMLADLSRRVAAIDGVNTVIVGKPGFMPSFSRPRG